MAVSNINHYLNINALTADASPNAAADYVATYDASAGTLKKVLLEKITPSVANAVTAAAVIGAAQIAIGDDGARGIKAGGWTINTATGDMAVGARGDILDLSGDGGEGVYSDGNGSLALYSGDAIGARVYSSGISLYDDKAIMFGNSLDAKIRYSTASTPDSLVIGVGAQNNALILCEVGDIGFDFAHAQQTNPTFWVHSANQATDEWLSFAHDQTDGVIDVGTGSIKFGAALNMQANTITGTRGWKLDLGGDGVGSETEYITSTADGYLDCYAGTRFRSHAPYSYFNSLAFPSTAADATLGIETGQTPDCLVIGVAADSNAVILAQKADRAFDFAHAQTAAPTLWMQSNNQSTTEWGKLAFDGLYLHEIAAANADHAAHGQLWVKNTAPCELWFTDDAGADTKLA